MSQLKQYYLPIVPFWSHSRHPKGVVDERKLQIDYNVHQHTYELQPHQPELIGPQLAEHLDWETRVGMPSHSEPSQRHPARLFAVVEAGERA
jgi:hypothetical protein